jgi:cystathionine gamma-synthase
MRHTLNRLKVDGRFEKQGCDKKVRKEFCRTIRWANFPTMHPQTLAIRNSHMPDLNAGAVVPPIYLSTTFEREADGTFPHGLVYSRTNNPNREALERSIAVLDNAALALAFASGQAAAMTLFQALRPGDHVVIAQDTYHGTPALLEQVFHPWGLTYTRVDMTDLEAVRQSMHENPRLAVANLAHAAGALCVCDNTWATPILQRPLELGCDIVLYSTTKYYGGHSDVLGGALVFKEASELALRVGQYQGLGGAVPSPFECWLVLRGIKTLATRIQTQSESARQVAQALVGHPAVEAVHYPGLESHPGHAIARQQMTQFGAMLSVQIKGGLDDALRVTGKVQLFTRATSLGGVESLIEHRASVEGPTTTTPPNLLRISIGLEHPDDLIADLQQALA